MTANQLTYKQAIKIDLLRNKYQGVSDKSVIALIILNRIVNAFVNRSSLNIKKYIETCRAKYKNKISPEMIKELNEIIEK